jgi:hypothetical protein
MTLKSLLHQFNDEVEQILQAVKQQHTQPQRTTQQLKYWSSRVGVLKSKFTPPQLRLLDGMITERARKINNNPFCQETMKETMTQLPDSTTPTPQQLEEQLTAFLNDSSSQVLLLQAPKGAGKTQVCHYLAARALKEKSWVPIFFNLAQLNPPTQHCVEQTLKAKGFDEPSISQLQEDHNVLLLIEEFDTCQMKTNIYVRNQLHKWNGKAIFTCRSRYLERAVNPEY